ncbi:MAG: hypothetical protein ABIH21_03615 [Patescibacteria group bacterium]
MRMVDGEEFMPLSSFDEIIRNAKRGPTGETTKAGMWDVQVEGPLPTESLQAQDIHPSLGDTKVNFWTADGQRGVGVNFEPLPKEPWLQKIAGTKVFKDIDEAKKWIQTEAEKYAQEAA